MDTLRDQWVEERPTYLALAKCVCGILETDLRRRGLSCELSHRAKEVDSLLKKAIRKKYANPWDEIRDKAGVRVIVPYADTVPEVEESIRELFVELSYENKLLTMDAKTFGYLGVHFEICLQEKDVTVGPLRDKPCEIQIHTQAQHLWSSIEHKLAYKSDQISIPVRRAINRLMALIEIFDKEIVDARNHILSSGSEERQMLAELERGFFRLTAKDFDAELSVQIIEKLKPLFTTDEIKGIATLIDSFITTNQDKLSQIFREYSNDDRCNPLLFQPESILIFERLVHNPFTLQATWCENFPPDLLYSLASIWGASLPE